jgi:hypothetical protein
VGDSRLPGQTGSVQALRNARFCGEIAHGTEPRVTSSRCNFWAPLCGERANHYRRSTFCRLGGGKAHRTNLSPNKIDGGADTRRVGAPRSWTAFMDTTSA